MESIRVQAKFVVVSADRILHPGQLLIQKGRIVDVAPASVERADVDLGEVVLLPGLINSHTHLEFSDIPQPFAAGPSFPDWIGSVVRHRFQQQKEPDYATRRIQAWRRGASECFDSGTALIGDIVTQPWSAQDVASCLDTDPPAAMQESSLQRNPHLASVQSPRVVAFAETIGLTRDRFQSTADWAEQSVADHRREPTALVEIGVSPHAPYSLMHPEAAVWCRSFPSQIPFAMHVAESLEEREWCEHGTGAFRSAYQKLDLPLSDSRMQISDAIELLSHRNRSLLIHGNYLNPFEMDAIAKSSNITVVYCPRTHQHFDHAKYPWQEFKAREIPVVFGTDSRASNPDLNLWAEMVCARQVHSELSPKAALRSITSLAAKALGCERDFGSLDIGKHAFVNVAACESSVKQKDLLEHLTSNNVAIQPLPRHLSAGASGNGADAFG